MDSIEKLLGKKIVSSIDANLDTLYSRWQDEKQYEDFSEYQKWIAKKLPAGATKISLTKKPFALSFVFGDFKYRAVVGARKITWKAIKANAPKPKRNVVSLFAGQKIGEFYLVDVESNRLRVVTFKPTPEQITEWRKPNAFRPGQLLSRDESIKLLAKNL